MAVLSSKNKVSYTGVVFFIHIQIWTMTTHRPENPCVSRSRGTYLVLQERGDRGLFFEALSPRMGKATVNAQYSQTIWGKEGVDGCMLQCNPTAFEYLVQYREGKAGTCGRVITMFSEP